MRSIFLVAFIVAMLGWVIFYPFAGVLLWTWFTLQDPHMETWGIANELPLNLIIAIFAIAAWSISSERKLPASSFITWGLVTFLGWTTITTIFAFDPSVSWPLWNRTWKIFALGFLIIATAESRVRIHGVVWIIVLSLFYYGVKGGLFTVFTGGGNMVVGPPASQIGDNNTLALALLTSLPLANYLRVQTAKKYLAWSIAAGMVLTMIGVLGSYSRGAFVALAALLVMTWLKSRRKLASILVVSVLAGAALAIMPAKYWDRIQTIEHPQQDASFEGRAHAWEVAYDSANDRFPLGAGFDGTQTAALFHRYLPTEKSHAAHSIFFQVLGDHGYVGLLLYLAVIVAAFRRSGSIVRWSKGNPELAWSGSLASMIQISLVTFCVGGMALSMAYYDEFVLLIALLVPLGRVGLSYRTTETPAVAWSEKMIPAQG